MRLRTPDKVVVLNSWEKTVMLVDWSIELYTDEDW